MRYATIAGVKRHVYGWRPDPPDNRDRFFVAPPVRLLESVDLRPDCPPIRDQYHWGSCTANACAEAMGFLYVRKGQQDPLFSRFFIYYFTRLRDGSVSSEDSGSTIRNAIKTLAVKGACLEATWPYTEQGFGAEPPVQAQEEALTHQTVLYYRCSSLHTVKASIAQGFPVVLGFSVPDNMSSEDCAVTGVVKFPEVGEGFNGSHCVMACGYNDTTQQIVFQNSWGTGWGDQGYGYLPYRFFSDFLATNCWTIRRQEM